MSTAQGALRIGEFARRVGVNPELLRAWERRYQLLQPTRSDGGFRLYTEADAERVARMRRALDEGLSAAEAARVALEGDRPEVGLKDARPERLVEDAGKRLYAAIENYDEPGLHAALDESLAALGLETVLREVILPTLDRVGLAWEQGRLEVGHEHFASNLIRGRLLALARLWGRGGGPLAVLACAPGEAHDISLVAFGLVLRSHGWRILFLGADTPLATLIQTAERTNPALVVLVSFDSELLEAAQTALGRLAQIAPLALSGPGASDELCERAGARRLDGDLVVAANEVARGPVTADAPIPQERGVSLGSAIAARPRP
jgi:MerR family transcriptional regulator, light-induced transcriptional regulator